MNYATIKYCDISNGPGVRTSLYVSGCTHHCKECFNPMTWDFAYGEEFTDEVADKIIKSLEPHYIEGITLLGGEPMEPSNQRALFPFIKRIKETFPEKTVWCFSGYTLDELTDAENKRCHTEVTDDFLKMVDVLVDGEFQIERKDITLRFRGSANQRLIDMNKTREQGEIVLWHDDPMFEERGRI